MKSEVMQMNIMNSNDFSIIFYSYRAQSFERIVADS